MDYDFIDGNITYWILKSSSTKINYCCCLDLIDENVKTVYIPEKVLYNKKEYEIIGFTHMFLTTIYESSIEIINIDNKNKFLKSIDNVIYSVNRDFKDLLSLLIIPPNYKSDNIYINIDNLDSIHYKSLIYPKYVKNIFIKSKLNLYIHYSSDLNSIKNLKFKSIRSIIINNKIHYRDKNNFWKIL